MSPRALDASPQQAPEPGAASANPAAPTTVFASRDGKTSNHARLDPPGEWPVRLSRRVPLSALGALLGITTARQIRGRRLLILGLLFALPFLFAILAHRYQQPYNAAEVETVLIFGLIPQALLPLTALVFASGMIQDDVEEQTLTYLLVRPIPRWLIYLVKLAGTWLVSAALTAVFSSAALVSGLLGHGRTIFKRRGGQSGGPLRALCPQPACLHGHVRSDQSGGAPILGSGGRLHRAFRGGPRKHRLREPASHRDVLCANPEHSLAGPSRRGMVDRSHDRPGHGGMPSVPHHVGLRSCPDRRPPLPWSRVQSEDSRWELKPRSGVADS